MAEMRVVLKEWLQQAMAADDRIMVIDADLAKASGTHGLREIYPERAIDVGIAEANMTSVAAGLSSYGFVPFITSFAPFVTRRICDQLMLSVAYAQQNVKIVGTDPGITAELNGGTHMGNEDISVIRGIPNIVIFEPVDTIQLAAALPQIVKHYGPVYIRLFRKAIADVFTANDYKFDLFKADTIKQGKDVSIFASGIMVQESLAAIKLLEAEGIDAELINIHTIKPIDAEAIINSAKKTGCVVTAENHNIIGGLKSAVSEVLSENYPVPVRSIGILDRFGEVGKLPYLMKEFKMTAEDIANKAKEVVALKKQK
ncbi:MAG: transketolase C-terminal domain-containing protein [Clostridia bacterium]